MNVRMLPWLAGIVAVAMGCLTLLLMEHIDPAPFLALLGGTLTPIVGVVLYSKVDKVEQQTNGTNANLMAMVNGVLDHLKTHNTVPMPPAPTKVTSTVESSMGGSIVDIKSGNASDTDGGTQSH